MVGLELNLVCKCCADHFCQDSIAIFFGLCLLYLLTVTQRRKSSGYGAESGPLTMKGYCDGNGASSCINRQMPHVQHEVPSQLKPSVLAQATQRMNTVFMLPPTRPKGDFSGLELNLVCKCCADHFCQDSIAIFFGLCLLYLLTVTQRRKSSGYGAESGPLTIRV